ncbi:APC family permease [Cryobacterium luteum]|uniref:APC family permease n=1 Tax=Cryobacterium luteum TaxID=1424661 RepID=A0A1H8CEW6_9MICO|nr:APC family permease [Cryobacterium luteum]TFB89354.1 APC family permease [Cryobacterium luteum]SEM93623.1 amino acid/polyamine/organocation transporter, APC superfamily [Cryobacterium luteum]
MTQTKPASTSAPETALHKGRLGVLGIVFFVVAAAAPLVGMTGAVPVAIVLGNGAAAPGAYLIVGLTLLVFSVGYAAMSQRVTNAGAFFAYIGRGLGRHLGTASAFVSILAYLAIQLAIYGFFGALMAGQVGVLPWWAWSLLSWGVVTLLSLLSVDVGAKVLGVLMLLELTALVVTAVAILIDGGPEGLNFWASFNPAAIVAGGLAGSAGIAFAFAFASFIGFEATAIYGEESKDPKTVVPRATYLAVVVITVLFGLTAFAMVTGMGASTVVEKTVELSTVAGVPLADPAAVLFALATQYVGPWMATLMGILVLSSLFAGLLAFQNASSRYLFALGRGGALPRPLSKVNGRGAPSTASLVTSVITGIVLVVFAVFQLDPVLNLFYWFSGLAVIAIVLIEILVSVAIIVYFRRNAGAENVFQTVIAPVLATIGLLLGEYLLMSRFGLLAGTVADGVDPTTTSWGLSTIGWVLVALPFVLLIGGYIFSRMQNHENDDLVRDVLS